MLLYSPISAVGACSSKIIACSNKIYAYSNVYTTAFNLNMKTVKKAFMMEGGRAFFWYDEARRVFQVSFSGMICWWPKVQYCEAF